MNKRITKLLAMAMPLAFVVLGVLAFSACAEKNANDTATLGGGGGEGGNGEGTTNPVCDPESTSPVFISKWNVSGATGSGANKIKLPLVPANEGGNYNFTVDWGDGKTSTITAWTQDEITHTYDTSTTSIFTVVITGTIEGWKFGEGKAGISPTGYGPSDAVKLVEINSFGPLSLGATEGYQFYNADNLEVTATDAPTLCNTKNLDSAFELAAKFNANISSWNVSAVESMNRMFVNATAFNNGGVAGTSDNPLNWDAKLSKVKSMQYMFYNAKAFNQPIGNWNVSAVTNMFGMFELAEKFNANISSWNVSAVESMNRMFVNATAFNNGGTPGAPADALTWNVSAVEDMANMFDIATAFNANISSWNVSAVKNMHKMFYKAAAFNNGGTPGAPADALTWNVSAVEDMANMFDIATAFNANISSWNVSGVTNMRYMFANATDFNNGAGDGVSTPLSWDGDKLANVKNMEGMFAKAPKFNANISSWNVSAVTNMSYMFWEAAKFNNGGVALNWGENVSAVTNMSYMFWDAPKFNANISSWVVSSVTNMESMFKGAGEFNNGGNTENAPLTWGENVRNVINMKEMFSGAYEFNQDIGDWNVSAVTNMESMFKRSEFSNGYKDFTWDSRVANVKNMKEMFSGSGFNANISSWVVSSVTNMESMFNSAGEFNNGTTHSIGNPLIWDSEVANVKNMKDMFRGAYKFNGDISSWTVSSVTNMESMFRGAEQFNNGGTAGASNNPLTWNDDLVNVKNMKEMFYNALAFNQPIGNWNVSSVTNMEKMFYVRDSRLYPAVFDQPIGNWNVTAVENMEEMFYNAQAFNQPIGNWQRNGSTLANVKNMRQMFYGAADFYQNLGSWQAKKVTSTSVPAEADHPLGCFYMFIESGMDSFLHVPLDSRERDKRKRMYPQFGNNNITDPGGCNPNQ